VCRNELRMVADLLWWLRGNGFTQYLVGGSERPSAMVFARIRGGHIDLAHVRGADRTETARIPNDEAADIWTPRFVVWHYYGRLVPALHLLRNLVPPNDPAAPTARYEPPRDGNPTPLRVSADERSTVVNRPPLRRFDCENQRCSMPT
jgi:hypothetical protein